MRPIWSAISVSLLFACAPKPCPSTVAPRVPPAGEVANIDHGVCDVSPDSSPCKLASTWDVRRCEASDPTCGPQPVSPSNECYRPDAPRHSYVPRDPYPEPLAPECVHDGECRLAGCGDRCVSFRARLPYGQCALYQSWPSNPPNEFCGCMAGHCRLFTQ